MDGQGPLSWTIVFSNFNNRLHCKHQNITLKYSSQCQGKANFMMSILKLEEEKRKKFHVYLEPNKIFMHNNQYFLIFFFPFWEVSCLFIQLNFLNPLKITCLFALMVTLEVFKVRNKFYLEMHIG